ncbi:MAG: hypothetical protein ACI4Q4_04210, partial [Oscillospiraceae bacterium]
RSKSDSVAITSAKEVNGTNGYNGASTYGAEGTGFIGVGYGASGGVLYKVGQSGSIGRGCVGDVKTAILDIDANITIACTIGAAGTDAVNSTNAAYGTVYAGRKGAIIVQYLGESM